MKQRILCFVLSMLLLTGLLPSATLASEAPAYIVLEQNAVLGETFEVEVGITNNPGIISLRLNVVYDSEALELVSVKDQGVLKGYTSPSPDIASPYTLRWADALALEGNKAEGTLAILTFRAKKTGSSAITIEHIESRDFNGAKILFETCTAAVHTVCTHTWGSWVVTREPNYLEKGEQTRTCSGCGMADVQVINNNPFTDVGDSNRFKTAILWAYYGGITSGTNKEGTLFSPDATVTRGQFVMFLWRMAGKPEPTITESPFPDVQGNNSFRKAVLWAVEKGITAGQKDGTFGLNNPCTRGQVVAFLYRYAGKPAYETDKAAFPDVSENNSFYEAVMWAVEMGITNGQSDGSFGLKGECKRSHAATFLYKYDSLS